MCPQQQSEANVTSASATQTTDLDHERWVPEDTSVISNTIQSRGKPKPQGAHACGVDGAIGRSTSKEPWKSRMPVRVRVSKGGCMYGT